MRVDWKALRGGFPKRHLRQWVERWSLLLKRARPKTLSNVDILKTVLWLRWPKRWRHKDSGATWAADSALSIVGWCSWAWMLIWYRAFILARFLPWRSHRLEKKRQRRLQRLPWGQCQLRYWSSKGWCPIQGQRVLLSSFHAGVLPSVAVMTTSSRPATVRLDSPIPDTDHLSGTVGTKLMRNDLLSVMCCVALGWVGVPPCWFLGFLVHRRFIAVSLPFSSVVLLISVTVSSLSIFISSISSPVLISSVSSLISSYSFLLLPLPLRIIFQELQATFCFMAELCRRRGWGWCNIFHF